jgi:3',5'-cyclic AMP phosphodiesterase CpdA
VTVAGDAAGGRLLAIGDLHFSHDENRAVVEGLRPASGADWLIVCGDVADAVSDVGLALSILAERFAKVIWVPGNHELLTYRDDPSGLRGDGRYRHLVELCRGLGVVTPEDEYPVWRGPDGPATVAPLFLLYDYSFGASIAATKEEAMRRAHAAGVVCVDEFLLDPDPYPSREAWCRARVAATERRLAERPAGIPTVLVNHFPLIDAPTRALLRPEFAQWCGTTLTADWHLRFGAIAVVYGHLHIPRTTWHDGVRFEEVSLGYPRERAYRPPRRDVLRQVLPAGAAA